MTSFFFKLSIFIFFTVRKFNPWLPWKFRLVWRWIAVALPGFHNEFFFNSEKALVSSISVRRLPFLAQILGIIQLVFFSQSPAPIIELPVSTLCFDSQGDGCIWNWNIWAVCLVFSSQITSLESVLKHVSQEAYECFLSLHTITSDLNDERASWSS